MQRPRSVYARLPGPRQGAALFLLCWAAYAAAYVGRYNYSAVMGAMTAEGVLSLQAAGAVSTGYFLCYAAGQVLSGFACQRLSPYGMIGAGPGSAISCGIPSIRAHIWSFGRIRKASAPTPMTLSPVRIGKSSRAAMRPL